ncbi:putative cytochrome P450 [Helianthus debilis subsp. tardiflorus]
MENFLSSLTFLLTFLMIFISFKWISSHSKMKKKLPPSPWKFPVIGNLHQLGSEPHRSLQGLSRKYGPIMHLHFGSVPTLVVSSAEAAHEIMKTHDSSFANRPNLTIPNILVYGCKDIAFSPNGKYWRQLKSMVVKHLLGNAQVTSFQKVREKELGRMLDALGESWGSSVDIGAMFVSLTENIICSAALGKSSDGSDLKKIIQTFLDMFTFFSVGTYVSWLSWVDHLTGLVGRAKAVARQFDEFLEGVIEEHVMKKGAAEGVPNKGKDFIDILLSVQKDGTTDFTFQRDTVKAVILDVFVGGIETAATSLEWVLSELVRHPGAMKKLQQEVTEVAQGRHVIAEEDLEKMHYLKAVIRESLRLHMPAPLLLPRISTQDVKLMGYDIPARTQVIVNAWAIGRDPMLWEEAEEFRPERFLKNKIDYKGLNFEWLPFGAGRRTCPGIQFGVAIMELAVANIVYKFDLGLPNGVKHEDLDMSEKYGVLLHKKSPLVVTTTARF